MTQITLTKKAGGHDAGATIEVTPKSALHLIKIGRAEPVEEKPKSRRTKATSDTEADEVGGASSSETAETAG